MFVLNASAGGALSIEGGVDVWVRDGAVVNSADPAAVRASGAGVLRTPELVICGGLDFVGGRTLDGALVAHDGALPDPLAWLKIPGGPSGDPATSEPLVISGGTAALWPGEYTSGLRIEGGAVVMLNPGVYVFGGAGLNLASGSLAGAGVTLVTAHGGLTLNGAAQLAAPEAGDLAGVVICQPASNAEPLNLAGGSATGLYGAVYAPGATVSLVGLADAGPGPLMGTMVGADLVNVAGVGWVRIGEDEAGGDGP
jgi:hypothetical protein